MSADSPMDRLRENPVSVASTVLTGLWLAALFTGQEWWLALMLVSYVVVIPLVALLFGSDEDREAHWESEQWWGSAEDWFGTGSNSDAERDRTEPVPSSAPDETPLETLRRRYAAGELTDAQFEAKLERLLETDTLENVEERAARDERDRLRDRDREFE
ncbi:SHOCT domain-containing protein [Halomarina oriensis]|uniref:SHOCT domain-containing protein n=1 Tax=Halomarina oriensis TaxID=671145 RepID=A0A6B0GPK4_9EURY|nr:SHOCT domain-containing protein [Halomarina oriensis]MWG36762.1 SHOCT domain-containing protein [Halomarina oriensis]